MTTSFLRDSSELKLNSTYRNVVDYLIISKNLEEGHWDENPVKTALCYRALEPIEELQNPTMTEEWMRKWFQEIDQFDKTKSYYKRNLRMYIEGATEIAKTLDGKYLDRETAKQFFRSTLIKKGKSKGSWQNDISLTAKIVGVLQEFQIEIPESTLTWIKSKDVEQLKIEELADLISQTNLQIKEEFKIELTSRLNKTPTLNLPQISSLLRIEDIDIPQHYISKLKNKLKNLDTFQINAGLTKALWQCVTLRAASFPSSSIKKHLKKIEDRYWVDYIEEITEDSKIILDLERDIENLMNHSRNIELLANALISLHKSNLLRVAEVPKKNFQELKEVQKNLQREDLIGNSIVAEKYTTIALGLISGGLLYVLARTYGFTSLTIEGIPLGQITTYMAAVFLFSIGYFGGIKYGWNKVVSILKDKINL